jgi:hypothetical protein
MWEWLRLRPEEGHIDDGLPSSCAMTMSPLMLKIATRAVTVLGALRRFVGSYGAEMPKRIAPIVELFDSSLSAHEDTHRLHQDGPGY